MRILFTVLLMVMTIWKAEARVGGPPSHIDTGELIQDDRFVPFPWSVQEPIAWRTLSGIWSAKNGEFTSFYVFRAMNNMDASYAVSQIDPNTCRVVASGTGLTSRSGKTFTSEMSYRRYPQTYKMMVRAYDYHQITKDLGIVPVNGQAVILSIQSIAKGSFVHIPFRKLADFPETFQCKLR